ncbi:hypothetical protein [Dactylosporangium sp. NPDC000521]|uniref:hypothetical protein n=1 Tax=Dactylosporangium sp. NPDC000521 TaxID=3363975 RepID=UPI0036879D64
MATQTKATPRARRARTEEATARPHGTEGAQPHGTEVAEAHPTQTKAASRARRARSEEAKAQPHGTDGADPHPMRTAAHHVTEHNSTRLNVPMLGTFQLPPTDELAFLGGIGVLAVMGAIEWPVAVVVAAGHTIATNRRNKVVHEFGEALEAA